MSSHFRENIKKCFQFLSFLNVDVVQVVEIFPCGRQGPIYPAQSMPWLLIPWWCKELGHQQLRYWCYPWISQFQHQNRLLSWSEWVIKFNSLSVDSWRWGPYSPYKPFTLMELYQFKTWRSPIWIVFYDEQVSTIGFFYGAWTQWRPYPTFCDEPNIYSKSLKS